MKKITRRQVCIVQSDWILLLHSFIVQIPSKLSFIPLQEHKKGFLLFITGLSVTSLFIFVLFNAFYPIGSMLLVKRLFRPIFFLFPWSSMIRLPESMVVRSSPICLYGLWVSSLSLGLSSPLAPLHYIYVSMQINISYIYCICQYEWYDGVILFL